MLSGEKLYTNWLQELFSAFVFPIDRPMKKVGTSWITRVERGES